VSYLAGPDEALLTWRTEDDTRGNPPVSERGLENGKAPTLRGRDLELSCASLMGPPQRQCDGTTCPGF
jgi:hypothetical protein